MALRSNIDQQEREFLEQLANNFGMPAVLDELRAICEVWAHRAAEDDNERADTFYTLTAASLKPLVAHLRAEIAKMNPQQ